MDNTSGAQATKIRLYRPEDLPQLERMHQAQGFDYLLPNIDSDPLYFLKMVTEREGKIVNAAVAHLTAEMYFLQDPHEGTPRQRFDNFVTLHGAFCETAYRRGGLDQLHAWIPPTIEKPFGRRLKRLGWSKSLWPCYFKDLGVGPHGG